MRAPIAGTPPQKPSERAEKNLKFQETRTAIRRVAPVSFADRRARPDWMALLCPAESPKGREEGLSGGSICRQWSTHGARHGRWRTDQGTGVHFLGKAGRSPEGGTVTVIFGSGNDRLIRSGTKRMVIVASPGAAA